MPETRQQSQTVTPAPTCQKLDLGPKCQMTDTRHQTWILDLGPRRQMLDDRSWSQTQVLGLKVEPWIQILGTRCWMWKPDPGCQMPEARQKTQEPDTRNQSQSQIPDHGYQMKSPDAGAGLQNLEPNLMQGFQMPVARCQRANTRARLPKTNPKLDPGTRTPGARLWCPSG